MFDNGQPVMVLCDQWGRPSSFPAYQVLPGEVLARGQDGTYSVRIDLPNGDWIVTTAVSDLMYSTLH